MHILIPITTHGLLTWMRPARKLAFHIGTKKPLGFIGLGVFLFQGDGSEQEHARNSVKEAYWEG